MKNEPIICTYDVETTGLDTEKDEIIELGWVVHTPSKIISLGNYLIKPSDRISEEIENITGITNDDLDKYGISHMVAFTTMLGDLFYGSTPPPNYFCGHNIRSFDSKFFNRYVELYYQATRDKEILKDKNDILNVPLIDTLTDLPYPESCQVKKLKYLGYDHGYINPFPHRAVFDALACVHLLQSYSFDGILETMKNPLVFVVADVTPPWKDGGASKEKAKSKGFKWHNDNKYWHRMMRLNEAEALEESGALRVVIHSNSLI